MKIIFGFLIVTLLCSAALCQVFQQWGNTQPGSQLLYQQRLQVVNTLGPSGRVRRTLQYPEAIEDEHNRISFIRLIHERDHEHTVGVIKWGGLGFNYTGVQFVSWPGRNIRSWMEVYS